MKYRDFTYSGGLTVRNSLRPSRTKNPPLIGKEKEKIFTLAKKARQFISSSSSYMHSPT